MVQDFPTDQFLHVITFLGTWSGFLFWWAWPQKPFRLRHLFALVASGFVGFVATIAGLVFCYNALATYWGFSLGARLNSLMEAIAWFLDQPLFPPPRVWHVFTLASLAFAAWILWRMFTSRRATLPSPQEEVRRAEVTSDPDDTNSPSAPVAGREQPLPQSSHVKVFRSLVGVNWREIAGEGVVPFCPRKTCGEKMAIVAEGPAREGMVLTAKDRGPRNVVLECSNPGCRHFVPANMNKNQLIAKATALFHRA